MLDARYWMLDARRSRLGAGLWSIVLLLLLFFRPAAYADTVLTSDGRLTGKTTLRGGRLLVEDRSVAFSDVLAVVRDTGARTVSGPDRVRLRSGEVLSCRAETFQNGTLTLRNSFCESLAVGIDDIAVIEFAADLAAPGNGSGGVLERRQGEAIRGRLVWFNDRELAVDGPLGPITIGRHTALRFVAAPPRDDVPASGTDTLGLTDGSIYMGRAEVQGDVVRIAHSIAGELDLPWSAVRFLQRHPSNVVWMVRPAQERVVDDAMVVSPPPPEVVDYRQSYRASQNALEGLQSLRLYPGGAARFLLPGKTSRYRAFVVPIEGAAGPVTLAVWAGKQKMIERSVAPGAEPFEVAFDVPAEAQDILVRALPLDGGSIPTGIELCDGFVRVE